ncbi:MAG: 16S rRNA (guanine(527)-N(7))-methyltransferase RsmG [Spirochaetota bacterium]
MTDLTLLNAGLDGLRLAGDPVGFSIIEKYLEELELWNKKLNLVGATGAELIVKHILDSLSALHIIKMYPHRTIADIGSGAGLPGIPLAAFLQESKITLIEPSEKKVGFLRNAVIMCGLQNVSVVNQGLEELTGSFDVVVFRAFRPLAAFIKYLLRITEEKGILLAYKGRYTVLKDELAEISNITRKVEIIPVEVPFLKEERHLAIIFPF